MGYRTHVSIRVEGKPQDVGPFKGLPTEVLIVDNYTIGPVFFDDVPEELAEILDEGCWYNKEGTDEGEIRVDTFLAFSKKLETMQEESDHRSWGGYTLKPVADAIVKAIGAGILSMNHYVTYEAY